ncbi:hypothetical protein L209DRAFT_122794 [Thermothelomyces heterothallicus CBS 203.75]
MIFELSGTQVNVAKLPSADRNPKQFAREVLRLKLELIALQPPEYTVFFCHISQVNGQPQSEQVNLHTVGSKIRVHYSVHIRPCHVLAFGTGRPSQLQRAWT